MLCISFIYFTRAFDTVDQVEVLNFERINGLTSAVMTSHRTSFDIVCKRATEEG